MIKTLNDIYAVTSSIDRPAAMKYKKGDRWIDITVPQFRDTVRHFATGLRLLGIKPGDRVAILSENRPEWTMADFAILASEGQYESSPAVAVFVDATAYRELAPSWSPGLLLVGPGGVLLDVGPGGDMDALEKLLNGSNQPATKKTATEVTP